MDSKNIITQITVKDKVLVVFYDKLSNGLFRLFDTDGQLKKFIEEDTDKAFLYAIHKKEKAPYMLNIASTEDFGAFEWKHMKKLLQRQMSIFMPLIGKFITDVETDTLEVLNYNAAMKGIHLLQEKS